MHSPCWGRKPMGWSVRVWRWLLQHEQAKTCGASELKGLLWAVSLNFILELNPHREMDKEISFLKIFDVGVFIFSQWLLKSFGSFGSTSDLYKEWQREIISRLNICGDGMVFGLSESLVCCEYWSFKAKTIQSHSINEAEICRDVLTFRLSLQFS